MRKSNQTAVEAELELTAQELLAPLGSSDVLEIHDVGAVATSFPDESAPAQCAAEASEEIELTAEQIDAMLEGRWDS